ncbi:sensor histidine kinase [Streptomyces sp. cg36]|uniref:sensor histidine kinase n=1 Tax=Streptomyces sp. cg36 TaxID=3238798 RepID=UPI0034E1B5C7
MTVEELGRESVTAGWRPVGTFERLYFAVRAPLRGSRWSGIDVLVVTALVGQTLHIALQRIPGILSAVMPSVAIGILVAGSFLWRRKAPFAVALLSLAGLVFNGARVPVFFALYALAKYGGRRRFSAILCCVAAYIPLTIFMPGGMGIGSVITTESDTEDILSTSVLMALPVLSGLGAAAYEETIQALHARERLLEVERERRVGEEKMAERLALAREMHDVLGHRIAIIALHAGALEMVVRGHRPQGRELARSVGDTARAAMRDLRAVLSTLRGPSEAPTVGSELSDLDELIATVRSSGLDVSFALTSRKAQEDIGRDICLAIYRMIQESLTNVLKYAPDSRVSIILSIDRKTSVCITNTVPGRPVNHPGRQAFPGGGFGLLGLQERVRSLGGTFSAGPTAEGGWRVRALIPGP